MSRHTLRHGIILTVLWALYIHPAAAYPGLFALQLTADTCSGPTQGYKGHGEPSPDADLTFVVTSGDDPVTSWDPGAEYSVTISHPLIEFHAYVYASAGTVAAADDLGEVVEGTEQCDGKAGYASTSASGPDFTLSWTAPECGEDNEVTIFGTAAEKSSDHFRQAEMSLPGNCS